MAHEEDWQLEALRFYQVAGRRLPLEWRLSWPAQSLELTISPGLEDQWMAVDFPYWEGRVNVSGPDGETAGVGFMELTGYAADGR